MSSRKVGKVLSRSLVEEYCSYSTGSATSSKSLRYESDEDEFEYDEENEEIYGLTSTTSTQTTTIYTRIVRILEIGWRTTVNVICVPVYWLMVQVFVFEKWLLSRSPPTTTPLPPRKASGGFTRNGNGARTPIFNGVVGVPFHNCRGNPPAPTTPKVNYLTMERIKCWAKNICWLLWWGVIGAGLFMIGLGLWRLDRNTIVEMLPSRPITTTPPPIPVLPPNIDVEEFKADLTRYLETTKVGIAALKLDMTNHLEKTKDGLEALKLELKEYLSTTKGDIEPLKEELAKSVHKTNLDIDALKDDITRNVETLIKKECDDCASMIPTGGNYGDVSKMVDMAMLKYDSERGGLADLALEPSGGSIVSTRCTKSSVKRSSVYTFFGLPFWHPPNNPRTIIQPGAVPGECWSYEGSEGFVVIQLVTPAIITGFTLEHIPKRLSPFQHIKSAPKNFQVVGLTDYTNPETEFLFGSYTYEDNEKAIQYFPVQFESTTAFPYVELKVQSNHGSRAFTCIYRFQVHGNVILGTKPKEDTLEREPLSLPDPV